MLTGSTLPESTVRTLKEAVNAKATTSSSTASSAKKLNEDLYMEFQVVEAMWALYEDTGHHPTFKLQSMAGHMVATGITRPTERTFVFVAAVATQPTARDATELLDHVRSLKALHDAVKACAALGVVYPPGPDIYQADLIEFMETYPLV